MSSANVGIDGRTLDISFGDGANAAILPAGPKSSKSERATSLFRSSMFAQSSPSPSQKALVLEPFASDEIGTHDADPEINVLQTNGFQLDQLSDASVTVNEMASLWKYNVVYMHTHAGVNSAGYSVFSTGQVANGDPAVEQLLQQGTVMVVGVSGLAQQYYGVLIPYIQQYENRFPADSVLYLDTCDLGRAGPLWQAFASKGVGAMITWDGHSIFRDETAAAQAFFASMGQGNTIRGALQDVHKAGLDTSTWQGKAAKLGFFGDGYITLHGRAADAPTNTPIPTATGTPTVTPTETPTSLAIPTPTTFPFRVMLKKSVNPGQKQIIAVASSPNLALRVDVTFPNGDQRRHKGVTDAAGLLRYGYVQTASTIRHGNSTAIVAAKAGGRGSISASNETYHIGFGRVDISVVPRTQIAGKTVTIWVHSAPFSDIALNLASKHKLLAEMTGRTGQQGWMHHNYRTSRGDTQVVRLILRAIASSGGQQFRTSTSLTID